MRPAKPTGVSSGEIEAAQQMVEAAEQLVAQRVIELENLEAETETLPDGFERQAILAQRDAARRELAKARGDLEHWVAALAGLQRRVEAEKKAAAAEQRAAAEKEGARRRRAWVETLQRAGVAYEALISERDEILNPATGFGVPSDVRQSLNALTWTASRWLKGASE